MNPFEHQLHAAKFNPSNFIPKETVADLPTENIKPDQKETSSRSINKLRPPMAKRFDLEEILQRNHSFNQTKGHTLEKEEKEKIEHFFRSGNFEEVTDFLTDKKVGNFAFNKEIQRVKKDYEKDLSSADFLNRKDWGILTAIELFDKKTFEHSIGTYLVARKKIEERLLDLGQKITDEGIELKQFYRSCLFHDIGKLAIPEFILNNTTTDGQWVYCFMEFPEDEQDKILVENKIIVPDAIRNDLEKLTSFFSNNRIRAVKFIPIKAILNKNQLEIFEKQGLNPEDSLGEIMRIHEKKSKEILLKLDYPVESLLAGNHHNYKHKDKGLGEKPTSLSSIHISGEISSNLIHLADVQQALNGDRSYHHKQPMLRIMTFLVDDAENGVIDPVIAARWINDELKKMSPAYLNEIRNMTARHQHHNYLQQRNDELLLIDNFLLNNLPEEKTAEQLAA
ncbi:MAG: hypothetical protein US70_C0028G0016 [Parcubacteria group bacterium GW2011_GWD2_38_11]|nr:MAG: hypothetical protein US70_C0028G0016 [Parcubacteria group bacterium GW2011_GWD2_38_11]